MSDWPATEAAAPWWEAAERPARRRRLPPWLIPGLLAVVVFELTADPALTVAVGCLKFGWDALATARWLKRSDPNRARGRACARFYAAWALWRVSLTAVAMMFLLVFLVTQIEARRPNAVPGRPPPRAFIGACLTAMGGFLVSAWMSHLAIITAWRRGVRVWVGPEAARARKSELWPPSLATAARVRSNRAGAVVLSALLTDLAVIGTVGVIAGAAHLRAMQAATPPELFKFLVLTTVLTPMFAILVLRDTIRRRVIAASPLECWPVAESEEPSP